MKDDIIKTKLACPKCKGTFFETYHVEVKDSFPSEISKNTSMILLLQKCVNCGWESNVTDKERIKERLAVMLALASLPTTKSRKRYVQDHGYPTWEGFVIAEEGK